MASRVYSGRSLTPEQVSALESIGIDENTVKEVGCRVNNTCGRSISDLLSDPSLVLYDPQRKYYTAWGEILSPWSDESEDPRWSVAKYVGTFSYYQGDRVIYLENNGYTLSVYEAINDIEVLPGPLDKDKWNKICSIDSSEQIQVYSYDYLKSKYPYYAIRQTPYLTGDIVLYDSACGDISCVYIALGTISTGQMTANPADSTLWHRSICVNNGKPSKCLKSPPCNDSLSLSDGFRDLICLPTRYNEVTNL